MPGGCQFDSTDSLPAPESTMNFSSVLASCVLSSVARMTRRFHPRGTERLLCLLHHPERRSWGIETIVPLDRQGLRVHAHTANYFEWHVFFLGTYEPEIADVLYGLIRPGRHAIDVGANVGIHTLRMSLAAQSGRVLACEPTATVCERLRANLALNRTANVSVHPVAVSARSGMLALYPSPAPWSYFTFDPEDDTSRSPEMVPAVTLDDLVEAEAMSGVDVIKIDTDGFEGAVLDGAQRLLAREHPALVFEYTAGSWARAGYSWSRVLTGLARLGYVSFRQITRSGLFTISSPPPAYMNVLATV
jgi:FkbM family methyltransferase